MFQAFLPEDLKLLEQPDGANTLENPISMQIQYAESQAKGCFRLSLLSSVAQTQNYLSSGVHLDQILDRTRHPEPRPQGLSGCKDDKVQLPEPVSPVSCQS